MNIPSTVAVILIPIGMNFSGVPSPCGSQYDGLYYQAKKQIEYCITNPYRKEYVLTHESAHYVWFEILSDKEREEYRKLWEKSKPESFYTDYSRTNHLEGFAEDYTFLSQGNSFLIGGFKRLKMVKKIIQHVNKL